MSERAAPTGRSPRPRRLRWVWRIGLALLLLLALGAGAAAFAWASLHARYSRGLPGLPSLAGWRPPVVTELVSADGQLAGELFVENREVVPFDRIPRRLVQAFIASEDQHFFEHHGVDWQGTLRAALNTYVLRRGVQGGSTLTQQTAKALLISQEGFAEGSRRTLGRKLREFILAQRLEAAFTKDEILWLYLNGVFLGHHSYGVQAAARNYFHKDVSELTLAEASLLAGLPQAPTRYSPFAHPEAAAARRRYVLRRMVEDGYATEAERAEAEAEAVKVFPLRDLFREEAPFYSEQLRQLAAQRWGDDRVLKDGLRVEAAMDLEDQRAARAALLHGLMEVDHRQGWYGPVARVSGAERAALSKRIAQAFPDPAPGDYLVGIVDRVDDAEGLVRVDVGGREGILPIAGMRWARSPNPTVSYPGALLTKPSKALAAGDVVAVRRRTRKELQAEETGKARAAVPEATLLLSLEQEPKLQGALVSVDPWSGYVLAMVGGYDFDASEFNRAMQACRQPGSAFKPVVYTAAVEKLDYTPATLLTDAPMVLRDETTGQAWKPENYGSAFKGDVTLRDALVHSMNIPAVKTAAALGGEQLAAWAKTLGLQSPVKPELGSALGSSCVTPFELANVYALLDRYGEKGRSTLVKRVLDRDGRVLEDHADWRDPWVPLGERLAAAVAEVERPRERVMDERTAYIVVHLMQEVATVGTGAQAARLGKPAAGKTGTTNDSFDTWFMGFTRDVVGAVWFGYDQNEQPLGRYETGGRAALPTWLAYMQAALADRPQPEFPVPEGIVEVPIDPLTGKASPGGVVEPFKEGTEPKDDQGGSPRVEVQDLFSQ
ncbi:penicillin-binding protein 1A [Anaeromyxobacter paludicola]|uniref:Penicillin-binding protein 1A n=1 Tax=Anaeromyxobacter paludicola TaxID=2918171 RepID=A0ABN6NCQ5_9BACT|nr:PBP1A family penicillin-binding protein [Anaeromyxobacter paludicola]BDG09748.1 penicillin-binding protein 1A [Anaeromyxobacter paludicola]